MNLVFERRAAFTLALVTRRAVIMLAACILEVAVPAARAQPSTCVMSVQPQSFTGICQGDNTQHRMRAVFVGLQDAYDYCTWQWYKRDPNGGPDTIVSGWSGSGYEAVFYCDGWLPNLVGDYKCRFVETINPDSFFACGIHDSDYATYSIEYAAEIVGQPEGLTACGGEQVHFGVQANNATSYRWYKGNNALTDGTLGNGTVVIGAATANLVLQSIANSDDANYSCRVRGSGLCSEVVSTTAHLTVIGGPPVVTSAPSTVPIQICRGGTVAFDPVVATGEARTYQWYKVFTNPPSNLPLSDTLVLDNSTVFSGTNTGTFTVSNCGGQAAGEYFCTVSNFCGTITRAATVYITIPAGVSIDNMVASPFDHACENIAPPDNQFAITCVASINGGGSLFYRWYKQSGANWTILNNGTMGSGSVVSGVSTNTLSITNIHASDGGAYRCRVSSLSGLPVGCGTVDSVGKTITISSAAPTITSPPSSVQLCAAGQDATFTIVASGARTYSWIGPSGTIANGTLPSGTIISGATTATLSIRNAHAGDIGNYQANVLNDCGANAATTSLSIFVAPTITTQPVNSPRGCTATAATFTVAASSGNLSYQWMKDGVDITNGGSFSNATTATLSVVRTAATIGAGYACRVSNDCGSVTSAQAYLVDMAVPITFQQQPVAVAACPGATVTFRATPGVPGPFAYRWRKGTVNLNDGTQTNGTVVAGATTSILQLTGIDAADAASYRCRVTNSCGQVDSDPAALTLNARPAITTQPTAALTSCVGAPASFTVAASGTPAPTFQWRKDTINIPGATNPTYSIAVTASGDSGDYDCVATNICGSATSHVAALSASGGTPQITSNPVSAARCSPGAATPVTFTVAATGTPTPTYQWRRNTVNIIGPGATTNSYTVSFPNTSTAGSYDCVVTNSCGSVTCTAAVLAIDTTAPTVTTHPITQTACVGADVTFSATASGEDVTYRWQRQRPGQGYLNLSDGLNAIGTLTNTLTLPAVDSTDAANYRCIATNGCGSVNSTGAALSVNAGVAISAQPSAQARCPGVPATFAITATGTPAPTYQWQWRPTPAADWINMVAGLNTDPLGGQVQFVAQNPQTASVVITSSGGGPAASHWEQRCLVTNTCGSTPSDAATLTLSCANKADVAGLGGSLGCDGQLTADDVVLYLERFFANDITVADIVGLGGGPTPDGTITADDLIAFLAAYFAGCP